MLSLSENAAPVGLVRITNRPALLSLHNKTFLSCRQETPQLVASLRKQIAGRPEEQRAGEDGLGAPEEGEVISLARCCCETWDGDQEVTGGGGRGGGGRA